MAVTAVDKDMITIWIADKDASPADCIKTGTPTGDQILPSKGDVTNVGMTGGDSDNEQRVCFGGNQNIDKPRNAFELSFDINPTIETAELWEQFSYVEDSSNAGIYTSKLLPSDKCIFIEVYDSESSTYHSYAWNNANIKANDHTWNAEDGYALSLTATVPTDNGGVANYMYGKVAVTALPEWSALDN
jgi:hypothetical protein